MGGFRATFYLDFRLEGCEEPSKDCGDMLRVFDEEVKKFKASEGGRDFWGCRLYGLPYECGGKKPW